MKLIYGMLATIILLVGDIGVSCAKETCPINATTVGFASHDDFNTYYQYMTDNDQAAAQHFANLKLSDGLCSQFNEGEPVYIDDWGGIMGSEEIRRPGEIQEYWTWHRAADCPDRSG